MSSTRFRAVLSSHFFHSNRNWTLWLAALPLITIVLAPPAALGSVPAVVADAQQGIGSSFYNPQSVAVAPNGTVYVADTSNNRVMQLVTNLPSASAQNKVITGTYTLTAPQAVAVDSSGDLFVSDLPVLGVGARIIEVIASGGVLTTTAKTIYRGAILNAPTSLVLSGNTLVIGDSVGGAGAIYSINLSSPTPTPANLNITLPTPFTPSGLALDSSGKLYISNGSGNGGVYVAPVAGSATAQIILTGSFTVTAAAGLALDSSGDLFVLSNLTGGTAEVIEVPGASPTTQSMPYIIPSSDFSTGGGMAMDASGNLDVAEVGTLVFGFPVRGNGLVVQLDFSNPVYMGDAGVFQDGPGIVFNFAFNVPATFSGFQAVTVGDLGTTGDVIAASERDASNCQTGTVRGVTVTAPYICYQTFEATPQYAGTRISAIQVQGAGSTIQSSSPVYELGDGAAQASYPLDVTTTPLGLIEPQGVAISGFDHTVYVADQAGKKVYSISGLNGSTPTAVPTGSGSTALNAPIAVAINGEGDLYIADFQGATASNPGKVVVVPTTTGIAPYVLNTGGLLQHPISLALDELGNVYIGDAGSAGDSASSGAPGYVVAVSYHGAAFKVPISVPIIFPQALAVNNITGDLLIGDGGDVSTFQGQVVKVAANGTASVVSITNPAMPTNPAGLTFDAAGNLYVLDGVLNTITRVTPSGASADVAINSTTALSAGSAMASSAGSQSFVITNLGQGTANSLVYLNGNSTTLAFGNVAVNGGSSFMTATVTNIGNQTLTLDNNFYFPYPIPNFATSSAETCAGGGTLTDASPSCTFSVQFGPSGTGPVSQLVLINSNAYNNGTPVINLTGTGTSQGHVQRNGKEQPDTKAVPSRRAGRKSFAGAGRSAASVDEFEK